MEKIAYKSDLDVGHILTPIYVENNTSHTKSVGILHKEYYKEHRQNKIDEGFDDASIDPKLLKKLKKVIFNTNV
jgi:hypothetical protein